MISHAILVLGIARSGTSALSGTLEHMGVSFGKNLKPIDPHNPKGNYEHLKLSQLNQQILKVFGSNWSDHRPLPSDWLENEQVVKLSSQIFDTIAQDFSDIPVFGIKDPRLVPLFPLYNQVMSDMDVNLIVIATNRNKANTLESIAKSGYYHGSFTKERGELLYDHYYACIDDAINLSGGLRINFEDLLYNTNEIKTEIIDFLPSDATSYLEETKARRPDFIDTQLHHHKN